MQEIINKSKSPFIMNYLIKRILSFGEINNINFNDYFCNHQILNLSSKNLSSSNINNYVFPNTNEIIVLNISDNLIENIDNIPEGIEILICDKNKIKTFTKSKIY
jgi:hypothetical protein